MKKFLVVVFFCLPACGQAAYPGRVCTRARRRMVRRSCGPGNAYAGFVSSTNVIDYATPIASWGPNTATRPVWQRSHSAAIWLEWGRRTPLQISEIQSSASRRNWRSCRTAGATVGDSGDISGCRLVWSARHIPICGSHTGGPWNL